MPGAVDSKHPPDHQSASLPFSDHQYHHHLFPHSSSRPWIGLLFYSSPLHSHQVTDHHHRSGAACAECLQTPFVATTSWGRTIFMIFMPLCGYGNEGWRRSPKSQCWEVVELELGSSFLWHSTVLSSLLWSIKVMCSFPLGGILKFLKHHHKAYCLIIQIDQSIRQDMYCPHCHRSYNSRRVHLTCSRPAQLSLGLSFWLVLLFPYISCFSLRAAVSFFWNDHCTKFPRRPILALYQDLSETVLQKQKGEIVSSPWLSIFIQTLSSH